MLPEPLIETIDGIHVVRDDLLPGGTKRRVIGSMLVPGREYVYASPVYGYAQVALAITARECGARARVFTAARREMFARTKEAEAAGAVIVPCAPGYMSVCRKRARDYAEATGATLLPFGFDTPAFIKGLADVARSLAISPSEVWCVAGSGTLCRALAQAWPTAAMNAVQVGAAPDVGHAALYVAPERFEQRANRPPPFPSTDNFDAKAWRFVCRHASPGALFWNVAR